MEALLNASMTATPACVVPTADGVEQASSNAAAPASSGKSRSSGRWTSEEHEEFLRCLGVYGREWKKTSERITTRTAAQIRSHAQKYFKKIAGKGDAASDGDAAPARSAGSETRAQPASLSVSAALGAIDDMIRALRKKRESFGEAAAAAVDAASSAPEREPAAEKAPAAAPAEAAAADVVAVKDTPPLAYRSLASSTTFVSHPDLPHLALKRDTKRDRPQESESDFQSSLKRRVTTDNLKLLGDSELIALEALCGPRRLEPAQ